MEFLCCIGKIFLLYRCIENDQGGMPVSYLANEHITSTVGYRSVSSLRQYENIRKRFFPIVQSPSNGDIDDSYQSDGKKIDATNNIARYLLLISGVRISNSRTVISISQS